MPTPGRWKQPARNYESESLHMIRLSSLSLGCLSSGLLLLVSFFFLCSFVSNDGTNYIEDVGGEQISVDRALNGFRNLEHESMLEIEALKKSMTDQIRKSLRSNRNSCMNLMKQMTADNLGKELSPISLDEVVLFLSCFVKKLNSVLTAYSKKRVVTYHGVWALYHNLAVQTLYPWDINYLNTMPKRRNDETIFLSVVSFRDENCVNTLKGAYEKAKYPSKLHIGLVQQNCFRDCKGGVQNITTGKVDDVAPDVDCYEVFCASKNGKEHCDAERVRVLNMEESESLGPYVARYFASKLWHGESWYMQIDSHMTFVQDWDIMSINMLQKAPSEKPIISHYPPDETFVLERNLKQPAPRICDPIFASTPNEGQIIRLEGAEVYDTRWLDIPRFAPVVAAGYFVAHSDILHEVPFDPFLPWIFMGEEIIMSARMFTAGYDIFSPTHSVVTHMYVREKKPKFWESLGRLFWRGIQNPLQELVLQRVKYQLGYPECAQDMIHTKSLLTGILHYSLGSNRTVEDFMDVNGLNPKTKLKYETTWCKYGTPPKHAARLAYLYT